LLLRWNKSRNRDKNKLKGEGEDVLEKGRRRRLRYQRKSEGADDIPGLVDTSLPAALPDCAGGIDVTWKLSGRYLEGAFKT